MCRLNLLEAMRNSPLLRCAPLWAPPRLRVGARPLSPAQKPRALRIHAYLNAETHMGRRLAKALLQSTNVKLSPSFLTAQNDYTRNDLQPTRVTQQREFHRLSNSDAQNENLATAFVIFAKRGA